MRSVLAILFLLVFSYHTWVKLGIVAIYELNNGYIAENLCVNKDKPKMHCNGKCYLKKQLKKAGELENNTTPTDKKKIEFSDVYCYKQSELVFSPLFQEDISYNSRYLQGQGIIYISKIFHPPSSVLHII